MSETMDMRTAKTGPDVDTDWRPVLESEALPPGGRRVVKPGDGKQIALFRLADGRLYACDNRCPHEGYPLSEGSLDAGGPACLLTCNWHNWKFDLDSGETLVGGDRLRRYPARDADGQVLLDLADPPPEVVIAEALDSLTDCFDRHEYDRMAREIARLEMAGGDPCRALVRTIRATAERFEYGTTHAMPAAADWLQLAETHGGDDPARRLAALTECVGHFAWDTQRAPRFPYPEGRAPWDADAFLAAIEAEDEDAAFARVNGALAEGRGWAELRPAFARAALAHYNRFGHSAIYTYKMAPLIARMPADADAVRALVAMLTRSHVYATREDLIPEFKAYAPALAAWDAAGTAVPDVEALAAGSVRATLDRLAQAGGADPLTLYDAAMGAAACQMLRFDLAQQDRTDGPVSRNVDWLDFTHALTFGNAVRGLAGECPDLWPAGLLQIGCFLGRNAGFTDASQDLDAWRVDDPGAFYDAVLDGLFDHAAPEYIVSAHLLKTTMALAEEHRDRPGAPWHADAAAALNRFLNSPLKRKHVLRTARQARAFVGG